MAAQAAAFGFGVDMQLVGADGKLDPNFDSALGIAKTLKPSANNIQRVANVTSPEAARAAFIQWDLREKAKSKFAHPEKMLFTQEALEQSSGEVAATYHASLFPAGVQVADLTVGIGGDLIALGRRGPCLGFELDPDRAAIAKWNLSHQGLEGAVRCENSLHWLESVSGACVFADPSRRVEGRRTLDLNEFEPSPRSLSELGSKQQLLVMKLSPLLSDATLDLLSPCREFLSIDGQCKEVLVFCGSKQEAKVRAVHVESGERLVRSPTPPPVTQPREFFFDCDPAAVRAHCLGELCREHDLLPMGDSNGYLTGSSPAHSVWLKSYRVLNDSPADLKILRQALQDMESATPVLKQRSTRLELEKTRSKLKMSGSRTLAVAFFKVNGRTRAAILDPSF